MQDDNKDKLDQIKRNYISSMQDKHHQISSLLNQLVHSDWRDAKCILELQTHIHKLSGSAGSYGFDSLSKRAMELDLKLKNRINGDGNDHKIASGVSELLTAMELIYQA